MEINTKYNIDQEVWLISLEKFPTHQACKTCLGDGFLLNKHIEQITCHDCKGEKFTSTCGSLKEVAVPYIIKEIFVLTKRNKISIKYILYDMDMFYVESNLYQSKEEAESNMSGSHYMGYSNL